nr:hypothetical protein [Oscillospiraceae bacterium]
MNELKYEVKTISKGAAEYFLMQHHHLSKQGNSVRSGVRYYGMTAQNKLIGVMTFTTMSSQNTAKGCFGLEDSSQQGFYEIGRFAVDLEYTANSCVAWFFAECLERFTREFDVRAIFSYIDPDSEDGTPFLENGFCCYGLTPKRTDFYEKMEDGSFLKHSRGKPQGVVGEWRPRPRKHRLLRVYDSSLESKWNKTTYPVDNPSR